MSRFNCPTKSTPLFQILNVTTLSTLKHDTPTTLFRSLSRTNDEEDINVSDYVNETHDVLLLNTSI